MNVNYAAEYIKKWENEVKKFFIFYFSSDHSNYY